MKITRHRKVRRNMNFYKNNFGFRKPYQIIVDATFCQAALKCKLNIAEQMPKYLGSEVKLMTTPCVISEVEGIGPEVYGAMLIVKKFKVLTCPHAKSPVPATECLYSMFGEKNEQHYMIATQDTELSEKIRAGQPAPILYVKYNAIILEKPSPAIQKLALEKVSEKLNDHREVVKEIEKQVSGEPAPAMRKRKRAKGPNPLSCKKKKQKVLPQQPKSDTKHRRRHKKKKGPKVNTS